MYSSSNQGLYLKFATEQHRLVVGSFRAETLSRRPQLTLTTANLPVAPCRIGELLRSG
jgi:hypothetical protein